MLWRHFSVRNWGAATAGRKNSFLTGSRLREVHVGGVLIPHCFHDWMFFCPGVLLPFPTRCFPDVPARRHQFIKDLHHLSDVQPKRGQSLHRVSPCLRCGSISPSRPFLWSPVLVSFPGSRPSTETSLMRISGQQMISWRSRSSLSSCVRTFTGFRPRAALFKRHTAEFLSCVVGPEGQTDLYYTQDERLSE